MEPLSKELVTKSALPWLRPQKLPISNYNDLKPLGTQQPQPRELIINFSHDPVTILQQLEKLAKTYKQVESLTLNFEKCELLTDEVMLRLSEMLPAKFPYLKSFTFKENLMSELTAIGYLKLATALRRLKSLTKLSLSLRPQFEQPEKTFAVITKSIKSIKNLTNLEIKLNINLIQPTSTGDRIIRNVAENLHYHTGLTQLKLSVDGCKVVSLESIASLAKGLPQLVNLVKFDLNFLHTSVLPKNLSEIAAALRPLKHFASLRLNFPHCESSPETVCLDTLAIIASLAHLKNLDLHWGRELSYKTLCEIATTIQQQENLTGLSLGLSGKFEPSRRNEEACHGILASIAKLPKLTELDFELDFGLDNCMFVTSTLITALAQTLQLQCHNLKYLNLKLTLMQNLTNANLLELAQAIEILQNLTTCSINIVHCTSVSAPGIAALTQSIGKLHALTELVLQIFGCPITDNTLASIKTLLGKRSRLTKLWLRFTNSSQLTIQGIEHLTINLNKLTFLSELWLELLRIRPEVKQQGKPQLETALRKLPNLKTKAFHIA
jgi:hypothetical protein